MRVGIIALQHESNTFLSTPTTLADFEQGALLTGEAIRREYGNAFHEVGGFFAGLDSEHIEAVPIFLAWALPGGIVEAHALEKLLEAMLVELKAAGTLDGVLVAPHGAGVAENAPDISRGRIFAMLAGLDLACTFMASCEHAEAANTLIEIDGFVPVGDTRLDSFRAQLGPALYRLLRFGGYAVPLSEADLGPAKASPAVGLVSVAGLVAAATAKA